MTLPRLGNSRLHRLLIYLRDHILRLHIVQLPVCVFLCVMLKREMHNMISDQKLSILRINRSDDIHT